MKIINSNISKKEIIERHLTYFKTMAKAVVDIERKIIALDGELHSDLEMYLLESGSKQENIWGINLYPYKDKADFIEYTALINIRPHQNNRSMEIKDSTIKMRIKEIVFGLIDYES